MKKLAVVFLLALGACASTSTEAPNGAQKAINEIAAKHSELVRLTLHAAPAGGTEWKAVASTAADRVGKASDAEDVQAVTTKQNIVKKEGQNTDVTVPIKGANGAIVAVAGVTVCPCEGGEGQSVQCALMIAEELGAAVRNAKEPLW